MNLKCLYLNTFSSTVHTTVVNVIFLLIICTTCVMSFWLVPYTTWHPRTPTTLSLPPLPPHGTPPLTVVSPSPQTSNNWSLRWLSTPWPGLQSTQTHQDLPPKDRSTQHDLIHSFICNLHFWVTTGCGTTLCTATANSQEEEELCFLFLSQISSIIPRDTVFQPFYKQHRAAGRQGTSVYSLTCL